ncbi:MAG: hypothetical protein ABL996_23455 [Micropepsaceae bacterium]
MRPVALAGILASTTILSGCAATIGGLSLSSISSFAGFASTLFTGADLGEHAVSLVSGKDCRFSEGLMRGDRDICEEPGSAATRDDFHGIFVERIDPDGTVIYAAPKYMSAGVGAGENENNPDVIWAQIKAQKVVEESERQLARANAAQTIDVASLASGSLSSQSLSFLPAETAVDAEIADGDTASQTASTPRPIMNAAKTVATPKPVQAPTIEVPIDSSQPAIDEKSFTLPMQATPARAMGEGGPFIATSASSTPVASTLINGEPVVVLRIGPMFATNAPRSAEATSVAEGSVSEFAATPSPQAILSLSSAESAPVKVASVEPQLMAARPRTKPAAVALVAETAKPKLARPTVEPARLASVARPAPVRQAPVQEAGDVFQPAATSDLAFDEVPSGMSPTQMPGDIPAEHQAIPVTASEPVEAPAATTGPASLVQLPQE